MAKPDPRYKNPLYQEKWRAANRERIKVYRRERYLANKASEIANAEQWIANNHERFMLQRKVVSANQRYPGTLTTADVDAVLARDGRRCHYCGKDKLRGRDLTIEHVRPVNRRDAIVIACFSCNAARIHLFGPRKTAEEKRAADAERLKRWKDNNAEHVREYHREYRRRWRAKQKKQSGGGPDA